MKWMMVLKLDINNYVYNYILYCGYHSNSQLFGHKEQFSTFPNNIFYNS